MILKEDVKIGVLQSELEKQVNLAYRMKDKFGEFEFVIQVSIPLFCSLWLDNWQERWIAEHEGKSVDWPIFNGIKVVAVAGWFNNQIQLTAIKKSEYKDK